MQARRLISTMPYTRFDNSSPGAWEKHPALRFSVPWDCQVEVEGVCLAASNSYFFLGGGGGGAGFIAFAGLGETPS